MTDFLRQLAPSRRLPVAEFLKRSGAAAAVLYSVVACLLLTVMPRLPAAWQSFPEWVAVPPQVIATLIATAVAAGRWRTGDSTRLVWALVAAFSLTSLVATFLWNLIRMRLGDPALTPYDVVYLADYALLSAAYAVTFVRIGGSFRLARTWLDALAILVALLGIFWATLLGPAMSDSHIRELAPTFAAPYALSLAALMTMAALLYLRLPSGWSRPIPLLLIIAGLADAAWEISWVASWLTNADIVGPFYNFGDVLCFTVIACAGALAPQKVGPPRQLDDAERNAYGFLPALSTLVAIAIVAVSFASARAADAWIVIGLVLLSVVLLVSRQNAVRRELAALHRATALRIAEERLTALVRESGDAILVLDRACRVTYASPATAELVGTQAADLVGRPVDALFGVDNRAALGAFLDRLRVAPPQPAALELALTVAGATRMLRVVGANHLDNANIRGLALTVSDITTERTLERDVLNVANQERVRLASDIHDGLAQQLVGMKMLVQAAARRPAERPGSAREDLRELVARMDEAIDSARSLAHGLSPLYVVRGSLGDALQRLEARAPQSPAVRVAIDPRVARMAFDENAADHLYRIAREAVSNAVRHGACTLVEVSLRAEGDSLTLRIDDDGRGHAPASGAAFGLGIRLMDYRARILGGAFAIGPREAPGTRVVVSVPLRRVLT